MKGIIVDFDGNYAIILTPTGDFKRIYNDFPDLQIGDELDIARRASSYERFLLWCKPFRTLAAACILIFALTGLVAADYFRPITFITMDINPSVEISLNRYSRVIGLKALNPDGDMLVPEGLRFMNKNVEDVVGMIVTEALSKDLLKSPESAIFFAVSNVKDEVSPEMEKKLLEAAQSRLEQLPAPGSSPQEPRVEAFAANEEKISPKIIVENTTMEKHRQARELNISQGKLLIYERMKAVDPNIKIEDIIKAPVSKILQEISELDLEAADKTTVKELKKDVKALEKAAKEEIKAFERVLKNGKDEKVLKKAVKDEIKAVKDEIKAIEKALKKENDIKTLKEEIKDAVKASKRSKEKDAKALEKAINEEIKDSERNKDDIKNRLKDELKDLKDSIKDNRDIKSLKKNVKDGIKELREDLKEKKKVESKKEKNTKNNGRAPSNASKSEVKGRK